MGTHVKRSFYGQLSDDATTVIAGSNSTLILVDNAGLGDGAMFHSDYDGGTTTLLSDPDSMFYNTDTNGRVCVYSSGVNNSNFVLKNRTGSTYTFEVRTIG